jgi:hypothetical protein
VDWHWQGFGVPKKRASGGGGSVENGMRCRQSRRGRVAPRGVALPSPAPPSSFPTAPSSSITKFAPGSSLLSPPSPDLRPRGRRRGGRGTRRATQRTSPHRPSRHPLSLSRERGREEGVGPACRRVRSWLCRQNRGSDWQRCPYTFFSVEMTSYNPHC